MEWFLAEGTRIWRWMVEMAPVLGVLTTYATVIKIILGLIVSIATFVALYIRGRRNKQRRVDALFVTPGDPPGPDSAPSRFLREEFQIVGFHGRKDEIKKLIDWAYREVPSSENVSVALVIGGPGKGKSRLARQLCEIAKCWNSKPWIIGFLEEDAGNEDRDDFLLLMRQQRPVLAIIDYAERRTEQVKKFTSAALASGRRKHPVRVLLIARAKSEGWWSDLENAFDNRSINPFEDGRVKLLELAPIENDPELADRRQEFNRALRAFREVLEKEGEVEALEDSIPNDLLEVQEVEMLDIHVAALLAAYGDDGGAGQAKIKERLFNKLIKREQTAWHQAVDEKDLKGRGLKEKPIRHAIAWLATTDGLTSESDAVERLHLLPSFGEDSSERREGVARIAAAVYPSEDEAWWGGVAPDRLTTWLTRELDATIEDDMVKKQPATVASLPDDALANLLRHLTWRAQGNGDEHERALANAIRAGGERGIFTAIRVGTEAGSPVGRIVATVLSETDDVGIARKISDLIGDSEIVLLPELALVAAEILHRNAASNEERASYANNQSIYLSALGRPEEALVAIEEAVTIRRKLAEARPGAFRSDLATSLTNLSNRLARFGRHEEALATIEEAVVIRRKLAEAQPDAFRSDLAASLNNLSNRLSEFGQPEEALGVIKETVALYRELARARHGAFRPELAASLNNLSIHLSGLGQSKEALVAIEETVAIRRELAGARPGAFRPELASSLNNRGIFLSGFGRSEEALEAIAEAVAIFRELEEARPGVFRSDLATNLGNLSVCLSELKRREEALAAIEEAVAIRCELAEERPDMFRSSLAESLSLLSACLSALGRREEASEAIKKANDLA